MSRTETRARPIRRECCEDTDGGASARNRYFPGKRLTPDALRVEQRFLNERRHLVNRGVLGWGVAYGYKVGVRPPPGHEHRAFTGELRIGPGLALDEAGRELLQEDTVDLRVADMIFLDAEGRRIEKGALRDGGCWLLRVHYAEQDRGPIDVKDPCDCTRREFEQVCETVRYSLQWTDCDRCCADSGCELQCDCGTGACCEHPQAPRDIPQDAPPDKPYEKPTGHIESKREPNLHDRLPPDRHRGCEPVPRGGCECICEHVTGRHPGIDRERLCTIAEECGKVRVDLGHGVALACVGLRLDECRCPIFDTWVEDCGPRRVLKSTDVLFDLIRGCDLTRISAIGWDHMHRLRGPVDWNVFLRSFGRDEPGKGHNVTDYRVEFSKPVIADTVRPDCFSITFVFPEAEGGWWHSLRAPISGVQLGGGSGVPQGMATEATILVDTAWVADALYSPRNRFAHGAIVEVRVFGDLIWDCNRLQLDADASGTRAVPSGNGSPGGTYLSIFRVEPRSAKPTPPRQPREQGEKS
jgi:hypothetical protein